MVILDTEDGDEDLGLADLAGLPVEDRNVLAGAKFLAHDHIDLGRPEPVVLAEPAVLEALLMGESVLLPEQGQGDAGAT